MSTDSQSKKGPVKPDVCIIKGGHTIYAQSDKTAALSQQQSFVSLALD
jgi:hypothetical protein